MKNIRFLFSLMTLAFLGTSIFLTSCNDEKSNLNAKQKSSIDNYHYVGLAHNEGLDYNLSNLKAKGLTGTIDKSLEEMENLIVIQSINFFQANDDFNAEEERLQLYANRVLDVRHAAQSHASERTTNTEVLDQINASPLSVEAKDILINALAVFQNEAYTDVEIISDLNMLSDQAANILTSPDDLAVVQSSLSVGIQTTDYWANGGVQIWIDESGLENVTVSDVDWKDVGNEDFEGAVTGSLTGLVFGPVGALEGAGYGALVGSATEIITQLWF